MALATSQLFAVMLSLAAPQPIRATFVDGKTVEGTWVKADEKGVSLRIDGREQLIDTAGLMTLNWPRAASQPATFPSDSVHVFLADGGRCSARLVGGDQKAIRIETSLSGQLEIALSRIAAICLRADAPEEMAEAFQAARAAPDQTQDTVLSMREGRITPVRGVVESVAATGVSLQWRNRSVSITRENLLGVVFASGGRPHPTAPVLVLMKDGSAWAGRLVRGTVEAVRLALIVGAEQDIPIERITEMRFQSDRVVFLGSMQPAAYDFRPFLTTMWPYRQNLAVTGHPLTLTGRVYERGLGVHSQSTLTYNLAEPFDRLAATVGIDDHARPRGSVVFRVIADGKETFNSGNVTGREPPRDILVPVSGVRVIQLVVDFGEQLDIGDHADWANIRLIK